VVYKAYTAAQRALDTPTGACHGMNRVPRKQWPIFSHFHRILG